ncbi:AAA family ATPase [Flavobacterium algoritolerans]|uniref:AAA family ATPase n=1 Tax=Flavobacterium algoritolerans TaxID=3041254 RepID=A0ABT6V9A6_9FLAO|nr:AAA family ATPase [Flavobacterium algoritolerans]MDI5894822.1 AAA family ATPase [Flavobacterium algoritolerans]
MSNNYGFYISKLHVTGLNSKTAKLEFSKGFNLVSGLSDTGKSYIFACINFMLGGGDIPKDIPESIGYTDVFLEIKTFTNKTFTLNRSLNGGNFKLKEVEIEKFMTQGVSRDLKSQHSSNNDDNISSFLLTLSGFGETYVRKDKQNVKRELSFRDIAKLTLIDEERIITEKSPVYSGQYTEQTQEQSVLEILLTGKDAKDLEQVEDIKIFTGRIKGKIEFADSLIKELSQKIELIEQENPIEKELQLQKRLDELTMVLADSSMQLEKLGNEKQSLYNEINSIESKGILQEELSHRFLLLKEHYYSDIKRLEFITEGEEYFSQLTAIKCPLCGGDMDKEHYDCIIEEGEKSSSVMNSIEVELDKIRIKLADLESTLKQLHIDKEERRLTLLALNRQYEIVKIEIQEKTEPIKSSTKKEVDTLITELSLIKEKDVLKQQLDNYFLQKSLMEKELAKKPKVGEQTDGIKYTVFKEFCNSIEKILKSWKYPNISSVNFDDSYKTYDIVLNDKNRKAHGKGIRAITYTSFVLGLMDYCINKDLPHSRNIILDSPLTTYQGKESKVKSVEIAKDMEDAFFTDLSAVDRNRQIIMLDNKDPNDEIISKINYIHFTGDKTNGRQGFFPI